MDRCRGSHISADAICHLRLMIFFKEIKFMSPSKSSRRNQRYAKDTYELNGIQWAAIGLIAIVFVVLIWLGISSRQPAATTGITPTAAVGLKPCPSPPPMTIFHTKQYSAT